ALACVFWFWAFGSAAFWFWACWSAVALTVSVSGGTGGGSPLEMMRGKRGLPHSKGSVPPRLSGRHHAGLPVFLAPPLRLVCTRGAGRGGRKSKRAARGVPDIRRTKRSVRG